MGKRRAGECSSSAGQKWSYLVRLPSYSLNQYHSTSTTQPAPRVLPALRGNGLLAPVPAWIYTCMHPHRHMHARTHARAHARTHARTHARMHARTHACIYARMYALVFSLRGARGRHACMHRAALLGSHRRLRQVRAAVRYVLEDVLTPPTVRLHSCKQLRPRQLLGCTAVFCYCMVPQALPLQPLHRALLPSVALAL